MDYIECLCKRVKCERYDNCDECKKHHHNKNSSKPLTKCEKVKMKEQKIDKNKLPVTYTGEVMDSYPTQIKTIKIQTETYKYGRFTKLVTDDTDEGTVIYLENPIEGGIYWNTRNEIKLCKIGERYEKESNYFNSYNNMFNIRNVYIF